MRLGFLVVTFASVNRLVIVDFIRLQLSGGTGIGSDGRSTHDERCPEETTIYHIGCN